MGYRDGNRHGPDDGQRYRSAVGLALMAVGWLLSSWPAAAEDAGRGLTVPLRAGLEPGAAIADKFRLYRRSKALVIGIDAYHAGWPRLSNAVKDARLVADALRRQGFDVTLKADLDAIGLQAALETFFVLDGADREARLFLWFAGHGHTIDGEGYLVPADAPRPGTGPGFKLKALPMRRIGTYVRMAEARHAFAVFDSCFSGTVFDAQRALPPIAITYATTQPVRQFLTSGAADQTVSDDGAFRSLFLRALRAEEAADANGDGYLTASELGLFLNDRMTNLTTARQTPRYGKLRDSRYDRGDFVFALPPSATPAVSRANNPGIAQQPELALWRSIENSDDPAVFGAFLERFPDGAFAAIARIRQRRLVEALGRSVGAPASAATVRLRRQPPEEVTWLAIRHSTDPTDFELYLERFPEGKYADAARRRLRRTGGVAK